jgi:fructose-1,6-bisphosphatase
MLQAGPPSLRYCCAVVLHSCIVLPPDGHFQTMIIIVANLQVSRAVFRIFIALSSFSFDSPA